MSNILKNKIIWSHVRFGKFLASFGVLVIIALHTKSGDTRGLFDCLVEFRGRFDGFDADGILGMLFLIFLYAGCLKFELFDVIETRVD